jgi:hypothetical protein
VLLQNASGQVNIGSIRRPFKGAQKVSVSSGAIGSERQLSMRFLLVVRVEAVGKDTVIKSKEFGKFFYL